MCEQGPSGSLQQTSRWPDAYGSVYRDCIPDALLNDILHDAPAVASCPNFWTPQGVVQTAGKACTACEAAISILYNKVMRHCLPDDWAGAEWWVQVYEKGKGLAFHFDKDEHLFKEERRMAHPLMSSILYLTGNTFPKRLGPTVVVDQHFDNSRMRASPEDPQRCALVYPRRGAFAVFNGSLGHGVLGSAAPDLRATLLINWWPHQPQEVKAITAEEAVRHSLAIKCWPSSVCEAATGGAGTASAVASLSMQQLSLGSSPGSVAGLTAPKEAQSGASDQKEISVDNTESKAGMSAGENDGGRVGGTIEAASGENGVHNTAGRGKEEQAAASAQPIPVLKLPAAEGASGVLSVDDLLYSSGLSIVGSRAVSSVAIDHEGWALYPLGDEAQEEQGDGEAPLQTAAVFVPLHMMPPPSSSSESGSEDDSGHA